MMMQAEELCVKTIGQYYCMYYRDSAVIKHDELRDCCRAFVGFEANSPSRPEKRVYESDFHYFACVRMYREDGSIEIAKQSIPGPDELERILATMAAGMDFTYRRKKCYVKKSWDGRYTLSYGGNLKQFDSAAEAAEYPFFNGRSLYEVLREVAVTFDGGIYGLGEAVQSEDADS